MNDRQRFPPNGGAPKAAHRRRRSGPRLREEIDRLFDDFRFALPTSSIFWFHPRAAVIPAVKLAEIDGGYELSVELPGIEEKNIEVEDGVL